MVLQEFEAIRVPWALELVIYMAYKEIIICPG
jgi:hypothetical protein